MTGHLLTVAMITEVFFDDPDGERLREILAFAAAEAGAELAVLPELPLDSWCPADRDASDEDAEPPGGPRQARMSEAARAAGVALLGGAIVRSPRSGSRYNTALLYDSAGDLIAMHRKLHLPDEEGYWETRHYEPGSAPPAVTDGLGLRLGIQVCSDIQRPQGAQLLSASGAEAILAPRCTPESSYPRWRTVMQAAAITAALYVVSVNRPRPERGVLIGGPSVAIGPGGDILVESAEPVAVVTLDRRRASAAKQDYPGYVPQRADLYALGWARAAAELDAEVSGE